LRKFADVGVDQVIFIQQGGRNRHDHICQSLELFADRVMPEFKVEEDERERRKRERLAPAIEAAMARKQFMRPLRDEEIAEMRAYARVIPDQAHPQGQGAGLSIPTQAPVK
jgi:hypothetical protein